jgi:hypothetical protein
LRMKSDYLMFDIVSELEHAPLTHSHPHTYIGVPSAACKIKQSRLKPRQYSPESVSHHIIKSKSRLHTRSQTRIYLPGRSAREDGCLNLPAHLLLKNMSLVIMIARERKIILALVHFHAPLSQSR